MPCLLSSKRRTSLLALLSFGLAACGGDGGEPLPVVEFSNFDDTGVPGCSQPTFPNDQPDLSVFTPPRFLLTNDEAMQSTQGQAQVPPGDPIEAEVTVNGATRRVQIELVSAWSPDNVIFTDEVATSGNETLTLMMISQDTTRGRFYMRLTLCGADCDERVIRFAVRECTDDPDDTASCGINGTYERTIVDAGLDVQADSTCIDLGGVPNRGSGTILIQ